MNNDKNKVDKIMLKKIKLKSPFFQFYGCCLLFSISTVTIAEENVLQIPYDQAQNLKYNPTSQARIRHYGRTGTKIYIQHSFHCEDRKQGNRSYITNNGGLDAFKSYARIIMNTSIGMPENSLLKTTLTNEFQTYLYISHKELILEANKPINLHGFVIGAEDQQRTQAKVIAQCENAQASFIPQAGHDYEVLGDQQNGQCIFKVYDLDTKQQVTVNSQIYQCTKPTWKFWKNKQ